MMLFEEANLRELLKRRLENYLYLSEAPIFKACLNSFLFQKREQNLHPLYFPIAVRAVKDTQKKFAEQKIYCPIFWPELGKQHQLIGLPIDDRYDQEDMDQIISVAQKIL
jgi:hypothetical protein